MSNATDYLENAIGNALFLGETFPVITQWTVHLFSSLPDDAGDGGTEISGAGYAPVRCDPITDNWVKAVSQDASNNTVFRNSTPILFPTALGSWSTIVGFGIKDQSGNLCFVAPLTASKSVGTGEAPVFLAGELEFSIG